MSPENRGPAAGDRVPPTSGTGTGTRVDRRRFFAALGLFLAWVAALGAMAVLSGRRPERGPAATEGR